MEDKITMYMDNKNRSFSMIADVEGEYSDLTNMEMPDALPILAVRNLVLFPGVVSPILIGRESSMSLIRKAEKKDGLIGVVCQRDTSRISSDAWLLPLRTSPTSATWSSRQPWKTCATRRQNIST